MGILDALFPKRCVKCKKQGDFVCSSCFVGINFDSESVCLVCNKSSLDSFTHPRCIGKYTIDGAWCSTTYKGVIKKLIYQWKYKPYLSSMGEFITQLVYESLIQEESFLHVLDAKPVFVPIPLSSKKLRQRGYNQAEILAKGLGKFFNCSIVGLLQRTRETKPQYGLKKEERQENMKGAFTLSSQHAIRKMQNVILVDDILTTGTTLLKAAKVLKKAGVAKVYGVCLARDQS